MSAFVAIEEPLLLDGIVSAILASSDLRLSGKSSTHADIVSLVRRTRPKVLIVDIGLFKAPFEAIKELKKSARDTSILLITGSLTPALCLRYISIGVAGCLLKKASATEITNAIRCVGIGDFVIDLRIGCDLADYLQQTLDDPHHFGNPNNLTRKELEVLKMASQGLPNREIAEKLFISERTVQSHFSTIFAKLAVGSRTEAVSEAWRRGWILDGAPK